MSLSVRLSVVCLSVTFVHTTQTVRRLKFSAMFLRHFIRDGDLTKSRYNFTEIVPGEPLRRGVKPKSGRTRNSSGDEIANVNFLYDDIVHVLQNTNVSTPFGTLAIFTEFGKHAFQHISASICGGIYARVYCIL